MSPPDSCSLASLHSSVFCCTPALSCHQKTPHLHTGLQAFKHPLLLFCPRFQISCTLDFRSSVTVQLTDEKTYSQMQWRCGPFSAGPSSTQLRKGQDWGGMRSSQPFALLSREPRVMAVSVVAQQDLKPCIELGTRITRRWWDGAWLVSACHHLPPHCSSASLCWRTPSPLYWLSREQNGFAHSSVAV